MGNKSEFSLPNIYDILSDALADGYSVGKGITISIPKDMKFEVVQRKGSISINFTGDEPSVKWFIIPTPFRIKGVDFTKDGGVAKIANMPDIPFNYS